jgi:hypothetical protein
MMPGMVVQDYNSSTTEAEAGGFQVPGQQRYMESSTLTWATTETSLKKNK